MRPKVVFETKPYWGLLERDGVDTTTWWLLHQFQLAALGQLEDCPNRPLDLWRMSVVCVYYKHVWTEVIELLKEIDYDCQIEYAYGATDDGHGYIDNDGDGLVGIKESMHYQFLVTLKKKLKE